MESPKFSICIIARNEENTLPRMVESLAEFQKQGGEILVLDTGSTDKTAKIAKDLGCIVHEVGNKFLKTIDNKLAKQINEKFIVGTEQNIVESGDTLFDYSSARNYIADFASNDVIATPDADEIYTRLDLGKLNEAIMSNVDQLEYNFVFSHDQFGGEAIKFLHSKFYNRKKMHWVGIVHEVLQGDGKRQFFDENVIKLEHWQNPETNRNGYLKGLALDCYLNPDNDRNSHYFARELLWANRSKSAIQEFTRHINMNRWPAERGQSMIFIGEAYGKLNEPEKQVEWFNKAFYIDNTRRESLIKLARFYQYNNNPLSAACYASAALEIPWNNYYGNDMTDYTVAPHEILYWAKGWMGDTESAQGHLDICLSYQPTNSQYLRDYQYYNKLPTVSFVIPTLDRPGGLQRCVDSIKSLNYPQNLIDIKIIDGDGTVPRKVKLGVRHTTGEWICYAANDVEFTPDSLILAILEDKKLVAFNTGKLYPDEGNACEHFIIKRDFINDIDGEIFDTEFNHIGVDNLLWAKAKILGEAVRCEDAIVKHYHFTQGAEMDAVYKKGWEHMDKDRELLNKKLKQLNDPKKDYIDMAGKFDARMDSKMFGDAHRGWV